MSGSRSHFENGIFSREKLVEFLRDIMENFDLDWKSLPFTQKYYDMVRQCFVRRFCVVGRPATEEFSFIKLVTKCLPRDLADSPEEVVDVVVLYKYENIPLIID